MNNTPETRDDLRADDAHDVQHNPLEFLMSLSKRGDVVPYVTPYGHVHLINHPDHIRHILQSANYVRGSMMKMVLGEGLAASEGFYWRRQRQMMQPAFHQHRVAEFDAVIRKTTADMLQRWQGFSGSGQPIDVSIEMTHLTLKIIGKALFSVDLNKDLGVLAEAVGTIDKDLGAFGNTLFATPHRIDSTRNRRFGAALATVDRVVQRVIRDRRRSNKNIDDLLSVLLSHRDKESGKALTDRQLRDEVVTMLLAGHVTLTDMFNWAWYLLSQHHDIEARFHGELARLLGGRLPGAQDLPDLHYTRMILQESLRLYPPAWFIARTALTDDEIGGQRIPASATVVVSPYLMHRHPGYWENPEQFNPDRFSPETSADRHPQAYIPFGGGQHSCIGNRLVMFEGQLVLAMVGQRYRLQLVPETSVEPEPALTLRIKGSLPMTLGERSPQ
jgi:cytochrome P450